MNIEIAFLILHNKQCKPASIIAPNLRLSQFLSKWKYNGVYFKRGFT